MTPTPPPPPAPNNGVAILLAEIERIVQELRALHKRPLPATQEQIQALVKLAERDRPLTLNVDSQAVATLLLGRVDQQAQRFQTSCDQLIKLVDDRTDYLTEQLTVRLQAVQAAEASLQATAQHMPREVKVNWLKQWPVAAALVLGPLFIVLLMLGLTGMFSRVPKEELTKVQTEFAQTQRQLAQFQQCRATLAKERPELAYKYFPYLNDPKPTADKKRRVNN